MGTGVDYLQRNRSGRLSYRREFPRELRPYVPGQPRELKRSLGGSDISAPEAAQRYREAAQEYENALARARKVASGTFDTLGPERLAWLADTYAHQRLEQDALSRFDATDARFELESLPNYRSAPMAFMAGATRQEKALAGLPIALAEFKAAYGSGDVSRVIQIEGEAAEDLLQKHGLRVDPSSPQFAALCQKLLETDIRVAQALEARFRGEPVPTPAAPSPEPTAGRPRRNDLSFDAIAAELLDKPALGIGAATKQATRTALRYLRELHGNLAPAEITRAHVATLRDLLARAPATPAFKDRGLPLPRLVERYANHPGRKLSGKTINQHLGSLASVWNKAVRDGAISALPEHSANPFARHNVAATPARSEHVELSLEEVHRILALPVFTRGDRPPGGKGEASYWVPLLLLFLGARPEEVSQLLVSDFDQDPETGAWFVTIADEGDHPFKGRRSLKTSKRNMGRRTFPVPRPLIDLGLPLYLKHLQEQEEAALFPALRPKGERKQLFAAFGEWWAKYLRRHGAFPQGEGRRGAREFRHYWNTAARESRLSQEAREYIMGHSGGGGRGARTNASYGRRDPLGLEIRALRFAGLDLSNVRPWRPPAP